MSIREKEFEIGKNVAFVATHSLCTGCATCEAVCPEDAVQVRYNARKGVYLPQINNAACTKCERCVATCPGFKLDLPELLATQTHSYSHPLIGSYVGIWRAYALDETIRSTGASGGIVTQILHYMLLNHVVDGAIVTRMDPEVPLQTATYIARCPEDLTPSQKSKYCPTPLNRILKSVLRTEDNGQRLAFVGLPSHVHGLRLLQQADPSLRQKIPFVISLFTSHVPSRHATEYLLYKHQVDLRNLQSIEYRGGGIPGRLRMTLKDGTVRTVDHLHWTYWGHAFPYFFYPVREWLQFDKLSRWADFSVGDNWQDMTDGRGYSTVITRTPTSEQLLHRMIQDQFIAATPMVANDLILDQDLTSKLNVGIRFAVWRLLRRKLPLHTPRLPVSLRDLPRTFIFAMKVILCERPVPYPVLDRIIMIDYLAKCAQRVVRRWIHLIKLGLVALFPTPSALPEKTKPYKITMVGGYGYRDIGDEAMPHADRLNLKALTKSNVEIVMLSYDPKYTALYHQESSLPDARGIGLRPNARAVEKIRFIVCTLVFLLGAIAQRFNLRLKLWPSARTALDALASSDLLFNAGGGNLNSLITEELYKKCTTYLAARLLRKPVILSGQTIGPFSRTFDEWFARLALNGTHMITFRDKGTSRGRLKAIGVSKPLMIDAADDAMTIPALSDRDARSLFLSETGWDRLNLGDRLLVTMNLKGSLKLFKGLHRGHGLKKEVALMASIADQLIDSYNARVFFVPTDFYPSVDDREVHHIVLQKMKYGSYARSIEGEYPDDVLKGLIGLADAAIGVRYHFAVFAASQRVPFLGMASGLYQQTKLKGLADLCGLPQCFVNEDMEFVEIGRVWSQVTYLIEHRTAIRAALEKIVPHLENASLTAVREAVSLLRGPSRP